MLLTMTTTFLLIVFTPTSTSMTELGPCVNCQKNQQCCEEAGCCYDCCPLQPQQSHFDYTAVIVFSSLCLVIGVGTITGLCIRHQWYKCCCRDGTRRSQQVPVVPADVYGPASEVRSGGVDNVRPQLGAPVLPTDEGAVEDLPTDPNNRVSSDEDVMAASGGRERTN